MVAKFECSLVLWCPLIFSRWPFVSLEDPAVTMPQPGYHWHGKDPSSGSKTHLCLWGPLSNRTGEPLWWLALCRWLLGEEYKIAVYRQVSWLVGHIPVLGGCKLCLKLLRDNRGSCMIAWAVDNSSHLYGGKLKFKILFQTFARQQRTLQNSRSCGRFFTLWWWFHHLLSSLWNGSQCHLITFWHLLLKHTMLHHGYCCFCIFACLFHF